MTLLDSRRIGGRERLLASARVLATGDGQTGSTAITMHLIRGPCSIRGYSDLASLRPLYRAETGQVNK